MSEEPRRIGAQGHAREHALQHGGDQRGAQAFAGDVGDQKRGAMVAERENVKVVAAHREAREIATGDGEMRIIADVAREQRLLNVSGDIDLLLEALAFALAGDQAGIVENAGGLIGESIEKLAIELGESRGAA